MATRPWQVCHAGGKRSLKRVQTNRSVNGLEEIAVRLGLSNVMLVDFHRLVSGCRRLTNRFKLRAGALAALAPL